MRGLGTVWYILKDMGDATAHDVAVRVNGPRDIDEKKVAWARDRLNYLVEIELADKAKCTSSMVYTYEEVA